MTTDRDWVSRTRGVGLGVVCVGVALCVFLLSYANGGFDPTTRSYAGVTAWWILGVTAAFGFRSAWTGISRLALWAIGLLSAFAIWTLLSIYWAPDAERTFDKFDLVSLYVAVLVIAILLARVVPAAILTGGAALGVSGVAVIALVSRVFPSTFGVEPGSTILPPLASRLSFPIGYWNGLAIEVALAYPLLLALMTSSRSRYVRAIAVLPVPVLAADMYLASSRGAFAAAGVAMVAYFALAPRRWAAGAAIVVAGAASIAAVATLVHRTALDNGQTDTAVGVSQGHHAAVWIGIICIVAALAWLAVTFLEGRVTATPIVGRITLGAVVVLALAAFVASHPIAKFDEFKSNAASSSHGPFTTTHLLSSSGSGRWQFWGAAIGEFRAHPLAGGGAGSWESWWLQHGSLGVFTQNAHSVYLEALAELGILGFLLLLGAVLTAVVGAVRAALATRSAEFAAAAACAIAFFAAAAYDWVWELAGIAVVGVGMLGVALGGLSATRPFSSRRRLGVARPVLAIVAVAAIIPQVVVLAAGIHLRNSQEAFAAGDRARTRASALAKAGKATEAHALALAAADDVERARTQALAAKAIEPWAATPYLQVGLIVEAEQEYKVAAQFVNAAIDRSNQDWRLWFVLARIDTERGKIQLARQDLAKARSLNPRSPVFGH